MTVGSDEQTNSRRDCLGQGNASAEVGLVGYSSTSLIFQEN